MYDKPNKMKVPIRPAPPPPTSKVNGWARPATKNEKPMKETQIKFTSSYNKKKPPPRPPPPKFADKKEKQTAPKRPSQLITNLFQRKGQVPSKPVEGKPSRTCSDLTELSMANACLIDLSSPPSSPTFTARSSDCVSVNSFGSDGVTPCSTSSGNTSNVESGFEDDLDFFGGLGYNNNHNNRNNNDRDPWSMLSLEVAAPMSKNPSPLACPSLTTTNSGRGTWVTFSSPGMSKKAVPNSVVMPTIIRVKPDRPPQPRNYSKVGNSSSIATVDLLSSVFESVNLNVPSASSCQEDDEEWSSSESPPMPTGPPPAPPAEVLSAMLQEGLVARQNHIRAPHAVALYDYNSNQPGDLSFKENDLIHLVQRVDENWFVGELDGVTGSVPANFVRVVVPVDGEARALYSFQPETWDDLALMEGDIIKVLARIDQDWLYGESGGKKGQFPAAFIDNIPEDLPLRKSNN